MKEDIEKSLEILNRGGVILYPTDTIWGIGCDATNNEAVKRIYSIKKRTDSKALLVLIENENRLPSYIQDIPDIAWELIDVADKPLTLIYPGAKNLAPSLIADDGSVGIRIVKEKFCEDLIRRFKRPIVSTSANITGEPSPSNFDDISDEIKAAVDYVVEYRQDDISKATPSGIIKLNEKGQFQILRK